MWTTQQILSFAPDAGIAQRAQELATARKWRNLQANERAIWGECKSSGATYYLTAVDLKGPAFKCNCPSRKFPCKHAIGLLLLVANQSDNFHITNDHPEWVKAWLEKRDTKKVEEKDEVAEEIAQYKREVAKAKTRSKRMLQMEAGIDDLEMWLMDTIRQGLASTERQGHAFWKDISARMVDAKLGGVGRRIESMQLLQGGNVNWVDRMLAQMADLYLVAKGFHQLENLPMPLQQELLSVAGVNTKKDEVLEQQGLRDEWMVMGQIEGIEDNLNFRRIWLQGQQTNKNALLLDYVWGDAGFPNHFPTGKILRAELCFYPRAFQLRAILKLPFEILNQPKTMSGFSDFRSFSEAYSKALFANPWLLDFPVCFENVTPIKNKNQLYLLDTHQHQIEVLDRDLIGWKLLAMSGGYPIKIFGEWTGELFFPLSAEVDGRLVAF
ncbi:MAG: SWIM zinc finger family protein [Bacteroidota bacterium]